MAEAAEKPSDRIEGMRRELRYRIRRFPGRMSTDGDPDRVVQVVDR